MLQAIRASGINVEAFITVGVSAALRQLLEFGLFHGDPHPGNIFAMRDGRIAYVDFGNVAELSQVRICCVCACMHACFIFLSLGPRAVLRPNLGKRAQSHDGPAAFCGRRETSRF